jgi:large subunit ribosomal protein L23
MKLTDVIRRPLVTEKSTLQRELTNVLAFEVAMDATKIEIALSVEKLRGETVDDVRTANTHATVKRLGRFSGRRSDWKKAYVRLKPGEKVPDILEIA